MINWFHYSGAGNTFLLGDDRSLHFDPSSAPELCSQAGVDGVITLEPSTCADVKMRIINCDGSEAEMCGNGLRCCIHFLKTLGIDREVYHIETLAGLQKGWLCGDEVCVQLASPKDLKLNLPYDLHFLNTGVPHAVYFIDTVEGIAVNEIGKALRFSPLFAPAGANINFVSLEEDGTLNVRTYERGVEGETLACGTGVTAAALISHKVLGLPSPVTVRVRSGQLLKVTFNADWSEVTLQGPAQRGGLVIKEQISIMAGT